MTTLRYFAAYPDATTIDFDVDLPSGDRVPDRVDVEAKLREYGLSADAPAYSLDLANPAEPRWVMSTHYTNVPIGADDVPPRVRANGERWLCQWAGEDCADAWHKYAPSALPPGVNYSDWRAQQELPTAEDVAYLGTLLEAVAGRDPTREDLLAFAHALTERLWLLTPVASDEA